MIFPLGARAALVLKPMVTKMPTLAGTRSMAEMLKETAETLLKIGAAVIASASLPEDKPVSTLDDILKPPIAAA